MKELFAERKLIKDYLKVIEVSNLLSVIDRTRKIGENGVDKTTLMWHLMQQSAYNGYKLKNLLPKNFDHIIEGCKHDGFLAEKGGLLTVSTEGRRILNLSNFLELFFKKFGKTWSVLVAIIASPILWHFLKLGLDKFITK